SPAMTAAGSPGVRYSREKTKNATTVMTTMVAKSRRITYANNFLSPGSQRGAGMTIAPRYRHVPLYDRHFFSTFQRNATGAMMTPEMFERYAVGNMNWPVGMNGTNSN